MSDTCARCGHYASHVATYTTSTGRVVERLCRDHAVGLKKKEGKKVTVSALAIRDGYHRVRNPLDAERTPNDQHDRDAGRPGL